MYKKLFILTISFLCVFMGGSVWAADKYPERQIQMIIPYGPGGATDLNARLMADFLGKYLGQPVVPFNKPGAGGNIGAYALVQSKPDGYTIGALTIAQSYSEIFIHFKPASYTSKDLKHVAAWSGYTSMLCVRGDSSWKSVKEVVEYARNNPEKIKWGNPGNGNYNWAMFTSLARDEGIKMTAVPFVGDGESMAALLGNHIDMAMLSLSGTIYQQIEAKKIRPLCLWLEKRLEQLPDVPTVKELGYKHAFQAPVIGFYVPKGTPDNIRIRLSEAVKQVTEDGEFKEKLKKFNMPLGYMDTKEYEEYDSRDAARLEKMYREMGFL